MFISDCAFSCPNDVFINKKKCRFLLKLKKYLLVLCGFNISSVSILLGNHRKAFYFNGSGC